MHHDTVELLNKDLEGEHAAIIQYLSHAYAMGEGEMACEVEAIAREEMRHLDWLAETVVGLGGTPTVQRGEMRAGGGSIAAYMRNDVLQEEDGIAMYESHIKAIEDPRIRRLLQRILSDERSHRSDFEHFAGKAEKERMTDITGGRRDGVTGVLDRGIGQEYTAVLQYLMHSYMSPNDKARKELEDQAINAMQHIGWLAEKLVDSGGSPTIEHGTVDRPADIRDMLQADIKLERQLAAAYNQAIEEIGDPGLKRLLSRIRDHEIYHDQIFGDLASQQEPRG